MDNLENIANQQKKKLSRSNIIYMPLVATYLIGGAMALILIVVKKRFTRTVFNVGVILNEMKSGRPAYLAKEELDVKSPNALGLPHGAVIAVGTLFFLAVTAHFTK